MTIYWGGRQYPEKDDGSVWLSKSKGLIVICDLIVTSQVLEKWNAEGETNKRYLHTATGNIFVTPKHSTNVSNVENVLEDSLFLQVLFYTFKTF